MAHYFIANHDKRFIAIASPKCASSAVRSWFLQTAGVHPVRWRAIDRYQVHRKRLTTLDDYERILFVRDPLHRLVGFYWQWVVRDSSEWCFLDDRRELSLAGATFRELIEGIERARRQGRRLQHHLIDQIAGLPVDRPVDHLALVERLDDELAALNRRFDLTGYHRRHPHREVIDSTIGEPVMERRPEWFDQHRAPAFERFYDAELAAMARRCFADDTALHASIPGARPLLAGSGAGSGGARRTPPDEIFVSIASYRDEFLRFTIRSALEGAHHPERVRFGICWQAEDAESLDPYLDDARFRVIRLPYWESRGYGWSRAEVQKLYRGEKYHLLIDSHSYLAPGWDENLIAQLERKPSEKPLLTTSAPPFTFDAQGGVVFPWAGTERDGVPLIRCTQHLGSGFLDFQMSRERSPGADTRTCFMVCNFVFTHGRWIVDVPEDPGMVNALHESALAVRTYTHGYDMFLPDENQVWHLDYGNYRDGRYKVWETKSRSWKTEATNRQRERLDALIYGRGDPAILGRYGRGCVRTVEEWAEQAGVDPQATTRVAASPHGTTLAELCEQCRTDKSPSRHNYVELYDLLFAPLKSKPIRLLEIGVAAGGSLRLWEEYFTAARIFGVDVDDKTTHDSRRVTTLIADQGKRADLARVIAYTGGAFDIVIDDGGHCMHQQQISFGVLFPALKRGGLYIIEDVHTSFPALHPGFGVDADGQNSTYVMIERFLRTGELRSTYLSDEENECLRTNIAHCVYSARPNPPQGRLFACWKK